jgi:hypothetical protein
MLQQQNQKDTIPFGDDFKDDDLQATASIEEVRAATAATQAHYDKLDRKSNGRDEKLFAEPCTKCNGTGVYYGYSRYGSVCFKCDGKKVLYFKRPKAERDASRIKAQERKERQLQENLTAVETQYPILKDWWTDSTFEFAVSMRTAAQKFGALTEKQLAAALRVAEKFAETKREREAEKAKEAERIAALPVLDVSHITTAFERAKEKGIKYPKMNLFSGLMKLKFSRAPDTGKNAGAVYVKDANDVYLGKIADGKFRKSYDCDSEMETEVIKVCSDPEQAAIAYGMRFGACAICSRPLTNGESIDLGIGPICASKFFG